MTSDSTLHRKPRPVRVPGSHIDLRNGRTFVSDEGGRVVLAVNDSAAAIWELCDGKTGIDEMVMAICDLSSLPAEQVNAEVEATIKVFRKAGLVSMETDRG